MVLPHTHTQPAPLPPKATAFGRGAAAWRPRDAATLSKNLRVVTTAFASVEATTTIIIHNTTGAAAAATAPKVFLRCCCCCPAFA